MEDDEEIDENDNLKKKTKLEAAELLKESDKVSSKRQLRYSTVENCFNVTLCLFMTIGSALFLWFLGLKRIDFVLSSPKCIESLLSTNQSHRLLKSVFNFSSIIGTRGAAGTRKTGYPAPTRPVFATRPTRFKPTRKMAKTGL